MKKITPLKIVLLFLVLSQLWIIFSDLLLARIATTPEMFTRVSMIKGGLFVTVTGLFLYWLIHRYALERNKIEDELRDSKQSYKSLSENLPGIIYRVFCLENNRIKFFNKLSSEITGYSDSELSEGDVCPIEHIMLTEDRPNVVAIIKNALVTHKPFTVEYRVRHKNGSIRFLIEKGIPIYSSENKILYIDGVIFDVTDRKQAEEALKERDRRLSALFNHQIVGMVITSPDKGWLQANDTWCQMIGYSQEELRSFDWITLTHPEDRETELAQFNRILSGEIDQYALQKRFIRKDGTILYTEISVGCVRRPAGNPEYIIGLATDITERKRAENELKRIEEERIERTSAERAMNDVLMEIHDGIGGITTNITILAELALRSASQNEINKILTTILDLSQDGMGEIRSLMYSLDKDELYWQSIGGELKNQGIKLLEPHHIAFAMTTVYEDRIPNPSSRLCLQLFRIYREALTNVIKHAKATKVTVRFRVGHAHLVLEVQDDGLGCTESVLTSCGRGIGHMIERAAALNGKTTIKGDAGTRVTVDIPLELKQSSN